MGKCVCVCDCDRVLNLKEVIFEEQSAGHLADLHRFAPASQHMWFGFEKYLQKVRDAVAFCAVKVINFWETES